MKKTLCHGIWITKQKVKYIVAYHVTLWIAFVCVDQCLVLFSFSSWPVAARVLSLRFRWISRGPQQLCRVLQVRGFSGSGRLRAAADPEVDTAPSPPKLWNRASLMGSRIGCSVNGVYVVLHPLCTALARSSCFLSLNFSSLRSQRAGSCNSYYPPPYSTRTRSTGTT